MGMQSKTKLSVAIVDSTVSKTPQQNLEPVVSSSMTLEQLRREFLHRHPSKKKLTHGKWKDWFLFQLGEGSLCVAPMNKSVASVSKSGGSSQESISYTVSTAPTEFSASPQNSMADTTLTGSSQFSTVGLYENKSRNELSKRISGVEKFDSASLESKTMLRSAMGSKKKYYEASRASRKITNTSKATKTSILETQQQAVKQPPVPERQVEMTPKYTKASVQAAKLTRKSLPARQENESRMVTLLWPKSTSRNANNRDVDVEPINTTILESQQAVKPTPVPETKVETTQKYTKASSQAAKRTRKSFPARQARGLLVEADLISKGTSSNAANSNGAVARKKPTPVVVQGAGRCINKATSKDQSVLIMTTKSATLLDEKDTAQWMINLKKNRKVSRRSSTD